MRGSARRVHTLTPPSASELKDRALRHALFDNELRLHRGTMSSFQEVFDMFSSARLPRMSRFMSRGGRTQRYSGGDGLAMPDADDEDVGPMGSDSPLRESRSVLGSIWWGMSSVALVAALMGAELPWWLLMVAGLEMCACAHGMACGMYVHVHVRVHVHVHRMRTACAPHVHRMCTACVLHTHAC